jgi:glycosyltransferase involved in cell wall biosynthesis
MASPSSCDLESALAEIAARRLNGVALVVPFTLAPAEIDSLAGVPAIAWVGQRGTPLQAGAHPPLVEDAGASVPSGTRHILFLGSWRHMPLPLKRRARKLGVSTLLCRVGDGWRHPPTLVHLAKGLYYKALRPLLSPTFDLATRAAAKLLPPPLERLNRAAHLLGKAGRPGLVLASGFVLAPAEIERLLALPGIAGLVLSGGPPLGTDERIGAWTTDSWVLPKATRRVHVIGAGHLLTRRALVAAIEQRVERVAVTLGPISLPVPLGLLRRLLAIYRRLPLLWLSPSLFRRALSDADRPQPIPGRIILVCGSLAPGGAERQVANTLAGLARQGQCDLRLLCDYLTADHPSRYDFHLRSVQEAGVPAREIARRYQRVDAEAADLPTSFRRAARFMPANLAADIANLYVEFRAARPEIVHAFLDWSSVRAGMAAALAGVPRIVLSGRNVNPSHFALYQPYMDPIYLALAERNSVRFVNNSDAGARDYENWLRFKPGRIAVLRNGVVFHHAGRAPAERIAALKAELGIPDGAPLIGGIFRLFPEKRPLLWVDAAAEIARRHPAARFVIWGQGVLDAELRQHVRETGLGDRLVLAGVTEDAATALSALDVFLLTSLQEGTPNVVLEAQWVGTPVVALEAGGTREALDDGRSGWIVDLPTPSAVADRVALLLDNPEIATSCRTGGPAFVAEKFGLDRMIDATLAAYGFSDREPGL